MSTPAAAATAKPQEGTMARVAALLGADTKPTGAVAIIKLVTRAAASKEEAVAVLRTLAAGSDGQVGTSDDLLPAETVEVLAYLIQSGVAQDIVAVVAPVVRTFCPFPGILGAVGSLFSLLRRRAADAR